MTIDVPFGKTSWPLRFREADLVRLPDPPPAFADPRAAVVAALDRPLRFESLKRAITPDDRIALVVDESLPHLSELIAGVLEYLHEAGIPPESVTAVSPEKSTQPWVYALPEAMADLQTETHQPADRNKVSYLSTTQEGSRIYLNRTVVDADQTVILCGRRYDSLLGHAGGPGAIYPILADHDTQRAMVAQVAPQKTPDDERPCRKEAEEVAWLLGSPFFVQVIEGPGDVVQEVIAGLTDTAVDGAKRYDELWRHEIDVAADVAVVTLTGDPLRLTFADLARAAACGARAVKEDGTVVILSEAEFELGGATDILRRCDDPQEAVSLLLKQKPVDATAAIQWCWAAGRATLHLASEIRPTSVEEIFATPLTGPKDVQRLIEMPGKVVLIPDGHKAWIDVKS